MGVGGGSVSCWDSITSSATPCCGTLEPSHRVWATVPPPPKGKPEEGPGGEAARRRSLPPTGQAPRQLPEHVSWALKWGDGASLTRDCSADQAQWFGTLRGRAGGSVPVHRGGHLGAQQGWHLGMGSGLGPNAPLELCDGR